MLDDTKSMALTEAAINSMVGWTATNARLIAILAICGGDSLAFRERVNQLLEAAHKEDPKDPSIRMYKSVLIELSHHEEE